ncbi:DUF2530 domain-containing protein [Rhodococcus triatomae]|uniref:DUF2530 domain-containing protein n=1 Tax=Rhodococcus triatomae TaxID=300028 RepID=A0A1G8ASA4_9NOCA|nr:DUF2530 domain-containing protein [Rhodococcus triatomae]QNG17683.1 DUF2530 domain-containing protein [Rhodococcus triatomae]QNG22649.1 DUF2530 domain-containing protein [Rhodococcus triatomae]SDH23848.1 Protein of unknown function [Rhodococcus triatomae]
MDDRSDPRQRLARLSDPRPALIVGTSAWAVAVVVVIVTGEKWSEALPICLAGIAVGALGYGLFRLQRRAALRGDRGAQQGLV